MMGNCGDKLSQEEVDELFYVFGKRSGNGEIDYRLILHTLHQPAS